MIPPLRGIHKIAVFRALQLGDMLCAIPAIRALKAGFPGAEITLIGLPWANAFVRRFGHYFARFQHFPGYPGLPEQGYDPLEYQSFLKNVRNEKFDLILQMQGNGTIVNDLVSNWGSKYVAGFYTESSQVNSGLFLPYPEGMMEKHKHLLLMKHLGIESKNSRLEFPITEKDKEDLEQLLLPVYPGKYVCIHPGSRGSWRQWPTAYFSALADYCMERELITVITGTNEERDITREVVKSMRHKAIDLTGKTSLGAMAALIKNACCLISNCTGVSHIADALQTPSVIISMDGEPERWGPENQELHRVVDWTIYPHFDAVLLEVDALITKCLSQAALFSNRVKTL